MLTDTDASRALRSAWLYLLAVIIAACAPGDDDSRSASVKNTAQALDTDSDGLDDAWESAKFGGLSQTAAGDFDSDGMTNLEEFTYGLDPTVDDSLADLDGDGFDNVHELRNSSDPSSAGSTPTPSATVSSGGGGTHTTITAAITAVNAASNAYPIIAIAAGTYTGGSNSHPIFNGSGKKYLVIGLSGAANTIIDGGASTWGFDIYNKTVIASLTIKRTWCALWVSSSASEVRFNDVVVRDNSGSSYAAGVDFSATKLYISGSTFYNNAGTTASKESIWVGSGTGTITNTVVQGTSSNTMLAKASGATLITNYSLVKGQTLSGTGNLAGSVDPLLQSDLHIPSNSPLRQAGIGPSGVRSKFDMDGDVRPSSDPDIGADQFVQPADSDLDGLEDVWELDKAGNLTTLTGPTQDADTDGLDNEHELANGTNPTIADTDGDGLSDGDEVLTHGTSPLTADTDADGMPDQWEVTHGLSAVTSNALNDDDGDRFPNIFEYAHGSDPSNAGSTPAATYVVNGLGGGTHTTVAAALSAANAQTTTLFPIIGIAPGVYRGSANVHPTIPASTKSFLIIGNEGAAKTIIDGEGLDWGWNVYGGAVVSSLTFENTWLALYVSATGRDIRFVDLLLRANGGKGYAGGVHVDAAATVQIIGSTLLGNTSTLGYVDQVWVNSGTTKVVDTVLWGSSSKTMLAKATSASLVTDYSLVKGQTLSGTGNLSGTANPKVLSDGHLVWDSPLRAAGQTSVYSRVDMDGEVRSAGARDIGVDYFGDTDGDDLPDVWEQARTGNISTLTGRTQDYDSDGLTNELEYVNATSPTVADSDSDSLSDGDEVNTYMTNPNSTDSDGDTMPDAWEVAHALDATVANAQDDQDGDLVPNIFEYAYSTDPSSSSSKPSPDYIVDSNGGGTHTDVASAFASASAHVSPYAIIGLAPGVYSGSLNVNVNTPDDKTLLVVGLEGAAKTIVDAAGGNWGWNVYGAAVISSITFRRTWGAFYVAAPSMEVTLEDVLIERNGGSGNCGALEIFEVGRISVIGSTLLENTSSSWVDAVWLRKGAMRLMNTLVWNAGSKMAFDSGTAGTISDARYSLVKNKTLSGTGNLAGTLDPRVRTDGRLLVDSPLRAAGGGVGASHRDMDGEVRPSPPDIGVDQLVDVDGDEVPDSWEIAHFGDVNALDGLDDEDGDGLINSEEYALETDLLDVDTDRDGAEDGFEVVMGMDPLVADTEDLATDLNGDGLLDSIGFQLGYHPDLSDNDGDSVSNADERRMCSDPFRSDSDGDGVPDGNDPFPTDPLVSALPVTSGDVTAPVITLTSPWYAVEQ